MKKPSSQIFTEWADSFEARSKAPFDKDHPKWLSGAAKQFRKLAAKKEEALEHKQEQRKRKSARH